MPATGDRITKRKDGLFQGMYTVQTPDGPKRKYIYGRKYKEVERQLGEIEGAGDLYNDQGLVFTTEAGTPINPSNLRQRSFAPLLKKAGLPHIRFHDLRHTCATLLLSKGVHPKFVQELLGHATIAITLDTYSHVLPGMGDQTAVAMENALSPMNDALP